MVLFPHNFDYLLFTCFFTGHAHNQVDRCVAAGYDNGDIKLFDLKNMSLRWETNVKNGVSKLLIERWEWQQGIMR